ncbi:MAG: hypothetical protein AAGK01_04005 [Pseudomonadota bacterium]
MPKRTDISALSLTIVAASLAACADNASAEPTPITVAQTSDEAEDTMHARWNIEVHSGRGIPGSPGADQYIANYLEVLQEIVDRCKIGKTVLVQATDGVSLLAIMNDDLSEDQIACVRTSERPGLRLVDWGTNG